MTEPPKIVVMVPVRVHQIDDTCFVWAFLDEAAEPERVQPGSLIVARPSGRSIVHLDVLGLPE